MTAEELMKPRYELIANYPGCKWTCFSIINPKALEKDYLDQFPHLFRKLNWWERRNVEDMPKKVKYRDSIGKDIICEIKEWNMQDFVGYSDSTCRVAIVLGLFKSEFDFRPID